MCSTELAYAARQTQGCRGASPSSSSSRYSPSVSSYALPGTDLAYAATCCARTLLRAVRYCPSVGCYGLSGTEPAYAATVL
eukprot:1093154-Rhodomonas_salina.1